MAGRWAKSKPLIIFEMIVYGAMLIWFLKWFLPIGFGHIYH